MENMLVFKTQNGASNKAPIVLRSGACYISHCVYRHKSNHGLTLRQGVLLYPQHQQFDRILTLFYIVKLAVEQAGSYSEGQE